LNIFKLNPNMNRQLSGRSIKKAKPLNGQLPQVENKRVRACLESTTMKTTHLNGSALPLILASALAAASGVFGVNSYATGAEKAELTVTASITSHCVITTVPVASGTVTTDCTSGPAAAVSLDQGTNVTVTGTDSAPVVYERKTDLNNQPAGTGILIATVIF
jgi:hypothetical protein